MTSEISVERRSMWQEYLLGDVVAKFIDYRGKTPKKTATGIPLITAKVVKNGKLLPPTEFIAAADYDSWMTRGLPQVDDVVLTTEAPLGEVALIKDKNVALAQRIITMRANNDLAFGPFLKFFFQSEAGQYALHSRASGTTVSGIRASVLKCLPVELPSVREQKAIAAILTCVDDKINLLNRQNQTLEAMAETVFRQWFLEAAEDNWVEYSVGDFADHLKQGVQPGDQPSTDFLHFSLPAFDAGLRAVVEPGSQILSNKFRVPERALLVSKLNPRVSRVWPIDKLPEGTEAICSTEFQVLKPKKRVWFGYLYGLLTSSEARDALTMAASGTSGSHQRVRPEDILAIKTTLPNIDLAEQFSSWVEPLISKRQHNIEQMAALERTRDTLLPKLMSGEVRVAF